MIISTWGLPVNNFQQLLEEEAWPHPDGLCLGGQNPASDQLAGCLFNAPRGWRDGHILSVNRTDSMLALIARMTSIRGVFHKNGGNRDCRGVSISASLPPVSSALVTVPEACESLPYALTVWVAGCWRSHSEWISKGQKSDFFFFCLLKKNCLKLSHAATFCAFAIYCVKQLKDCLKLKLPQVHISFCTHFVCMPINISHILLESQCYREVAQRLRCSLFKLSGSVHNHFFVCL